MKKRGWALLVNNSVKYDRGYTKFEYVLEEYNFWNNSSGFQKKY